MIIIMIKVEGRAGEEDRWMIIIMIKVEGRGRRGGQMDDNNYDKGGGEELERRTDG